MMQIESNVLLSMIVCSIIDSFLNRNMRGFFKKHSNCNFKKYANINYIYFRYGIYFKSGCANIKR